MLAMLLDRYRPESEAETADVRRVRALGGGAPKRLHVCTSCIRAGKVTKPLRRTHETSPTG